MHDDMTSKQDQLYQHGFEQITVFWQGYNDESLIMLVGNRKDQKNKIKLLCQDLFLNSVEFILLIH